MNEITKQHSVYQEKRIILGKEVPLESPLSIVIDTSEVCNLKCTYCFRAHSESRDSSYVWKNNVMSWETFRLIVEQIKMFKHKPKKISLSGHGEPLINKKLPEMVEYIKENLPESSVEIHTNGTLLTEKFAIELAESQIDKINVSLQGVTAKKYKDICGVDIDFDAFLHGIRTLYTHKSKTKVNIQIVDIAIEDDEKQRLFDLFEPISDNIVINRTVPLWKNVDYESVLKETADDVNKYGKSVQYQKACSFVFYTLVITPEGDVYPCTQHTMGLLLGNIQNKNLYECWNSKERTEFLKQHIKHGRVSIDDCKDCYIAQNSIMTQEDSLNDYLDEISTRMDRGEFNIDK
ncbi:radical SAM/SPASM domain-containing protein [Oceanirhabdus seepicola]|uniref:Radical SAM protein n=1 Tax=Oceanirhabdus seepicola TaxID=2828781 RepID=A0A9J6PDS8_9CLOT|nr:radical SAM protein [Oceanirhabdus seepicola]MCM1992624.1 radical SAM protein [Oceanirhabdus seepicola]